MAGNHAGVEHQVEVVHPHVSAEGPEGVGERAGAGKAGQRLRLRPGQGAAERAGLEGARDKLDCGRAKLGCGRPTNCRRIGRAELDCDLFCSTIILVQFLKLKIKARRRTPARAQNNARLKVREMNSEQFLCFAQKIIHHPSLEFSS